MAYRIPPGARRALAPQAADGDGTAPQGPHPGAAAGVPVGYGVCLTCGAPVYVTPQHVYPVTPAGVGSATGEGGLVSTVTTSVSSDVVCADASGFCLHVPAACVSDEPPSNAS